MPPEFQFDHVLVGRVSRIDGSLLFHFSQPFQKILVALDVWQDQVLASSPKYFSETLQIAVENILGLVDVIEGITQVGAVKKKFFSKRRAC